MSHWKDRKMGWAIRVNDSGELLGDGGRAWVYRTRDEATWVRKQFSTRDMTVIKVRIQYEAID